MLSFADRVEVPKHVLVRFLEEECVFLNLEAEMYYGLNETGTGMWQVLTTAPNIETAYVQLLSEFDVEPELLRQDISELVEQLVNNGLLWIRPADVQSAPAT
jgi:hypothetical protein